MKETKIQKIKKDDSSAILRMFFLNFDNKIINFINMFSLAYQIVSTLIQVYFIITNISLELITRYSTMLIVNCYSMFAMIFLIIFEKNMIKLDNFFISFAWSIDNAGEVTARDIKGTSAKINRIICFMLGLNLIVMIIYFPFCGNQSELFIWERVCDRYFGIWSKLFYHIYFATIPSLVYSGVRLGFILIHGIWNLKNQVLLIIAYILKISDDFADLDDWQKLHSVQYQNAIFERLCLCIKHHVTLKRHIRQIHEIVEIAMPWFLLFATLIFITSIVFVLNYIETMSNVLKLRFCTAGCNFALVLIIFCEAGQSLVDETGRVFEVLGSSSWYIWNVKNRRILLNFMTNCVNPIKFSFAGISLDYRLAVS
ncbi:hypothetical protein BDFB_011489, partial [Asbolus verrucosus]